MKENAYIDRYTSGLSDDDISSKLSNPFLELLGARLVEWKQGYAEMTLPISPTLKNRSGAVQGGVLCTLLDATGGYAGLYSPPGETKVHGLTVSLAVNFIANGQGSILTSKGFIDKAGTSVYFAHSEVWLDANILLATAIGSYRYLA